MILRVAVVDNSGKPLPGVSLQLGDEMIGVTDELGQFYLPRKPMEPGQYRLTLSRLGYKTRQSQVSIPQENLITIRLEPEAPPISPKVGKQAPNYRRYEIFYATDRRRANTQDPEEFYGNQRSPEGQVELGVCDVSIPGTHVLGEIESPSWLHLEFKVDPDKHVEMYKPQPLDADPFFRRLAARIAALERERGVCLHSRL